MTTPAAAATLPNAPSNLKGSVTSATQASLSWTDNSNNETGFQIERWNGSAWTQIGSVGANVTTYADSGLSPSSTYYYDVVAYNGAGTNWATSDAVVTTPAAAGLATDANIQMLATIITSEADGCNATEKLGVGSCVINRMTQNGLTNVSDVLGNGNQFAHGKSPTSDAVDLAHGLLSGTIAPFAGITHFYSPISMPREGASTAGYDVSGGLEQVAGLSYRTYRPGWATTMQYVPIVNVREMYFKFFM